MGGSWGGARRGPRAPQKAGSAAWRTSPPPPWRPLGRALARHSQGAASPHLRLGCLGHAVPVPTAHSLHPPPSSTTCPSLAQADPAGFKRSRQDYWERPRGPASSQNNLTPVPRHLGGWGAGTRSCEQHQALGRAGAGDGDMGGGQGGGERHGERVMARKTKRRKGAHRGLGNAVPERGTGRDGRACTPDQGAPAPLEGSFPRTPAGQASLQRREGAAPLSWGLARGTAEQEVVLAGWSMQGWGPHGAPRAPGAPSDGVGPHRPSEDLKDSSYSLPIFPEGSSRLRGAR